MATANPSAINDWYSKYKGGKQPAGILPAQAMAGPQGDPTLGDTPNAIDPTKFDVTNRVQGYDPNTTPGANWNVGNDQTVQGQLKGIIDQDSPLQQQAKTRSMQDMNARGLLSSSMAVGAGQGAVIASALPIAQQDAQTFGNASRFNAEATNRAAEFTAGAKNTGLIESARMGLNAEQSNQRSSLDRQMQQAGFAQQTAVQSADIANQKAMQGASFQQQTAVQATDIAAQSQRQIADIQAQAAQQGRQLTAQEQAQIRDLQNQQGMQKASFGQQKDIQATDIVAQAQRQVADIQAQAAQQGRQLTAQEQAQIRDIQNRTGMQQAGFAQQTGLQDRDFAQQSKTQAADLASRYNLAGMDVQSRAALQQADAANQQTLQKANAALQTGLQSTDLAVKQSMQGYDAAIKQSMQGVDNASKLSIARLDANNRIALVAIEAKFKKELQGSQSMASSYQSMVDNFTRVMLNNDLNDVTKPKVINDLTKMYTNTLKMQSDISELKIGDLLYEDARNYGPELPQQQVPRRNNIFDRIFYQ